MDYDNIFSVHNLPYGVISHSKSKEPHCAIAYRSFAIDLALCQIQVPNLPLLQSALSQSNWNSFAELGRPSHQAFRARLRKAIEDGDFDMPSGKYMSALVPLNECTMHFPMDTRNYSDFYCSHEHASNCAAVFGYGMNPTWFKMPQVYNGRTSSLALSGTPIVRPCGIIPAETEMDPAKPGEKPLIFAPEPKLDFELEMGVFLSSPVRRGERMNIGNAKDHIFGFVLLNDWSARAIQYTEMAPLGPFHSKGSLTSISPWIVSLEAMEEMASCQRYQVQEPPAMDHLRSSDHNKATWNVEVQCVVVRDSKQYIFSESNLNELHWTPLQQLTHLGSAGEGLSPGDIFGTGTISSGRVNDKGEKTGLSCIWERQAKGCDFKGLPHGYLEDFLKDGDEVVLSAVVKGQDGRVKLGFGECRGKILPAVI